MPGRGGQRGICSRNMLKWLWSRDRGEWVGIISRYALQMIGISRCITTALRLMRSSTPADGSYWKSFLNRQKTRLILDYNLKRFLDLYIFLNILDISHYIENLRDRIFPTFICLKHQNIETKNLQYFRLEVSIT